MPNMGVRENEQKTNANTFFFVRPFVCSFYVRQIKFASTHTNSRAKKFARKMCWKEGSRGRRINFEFSNCNKLNVSGDKILCAAIWCFFLSSMLPLLPCSLCLISFQLFALRYDVTRLIKFIGFFFCCY